MNLGNRLLARELQNKEASDVIDIEGKVRAIRKRLFKQQLNFIDDPSRNKAILCPRRAGKSHAMVSDMLITCLNKAKARCVYIAITRGHAKRLIWDTMRSLIKEFELSAKFNNRELIIHFEHNDSQIMLGGADSEAEIEKYRGGWFNRVYIDESASFPPSLITTLIEDIISPTLSDYFGVLTLAGTPGVVLAGTFYEVTRPDSVVSVTYGSEKKAVWTFHRWTTKENVSMPHIWEDQLLRKEQNGVKDNDPRWRREWLGEWVADNSSLCFKFNPSRDTYTGELPSGHNWEYVLGIDFGFDDPMAFVVLAYSETHPICYQVFSHTEQGMAVHQVAAKIEELQGEYGSFAAMVGDRGNLAKMVFAELAQRYAIYITPADKHEKRDHVELINSDFISGKLKVLSNTELTDHLSEIQWDAKGKNFQRGFQDHDLDAFLYAWRYAYHYLWEKKPRALDKRSMEYKIAMEAEEEARIAAQGPLGSKEWWESDDDLFVEDIYEPY